MHSVKSKLFRILAPALLLATVPVPAAAQENDKKAPAGWKVRADDPAQAASDVAFVDMPPGWHVTTGPHVILYHPDSTATGNYRVEVETFLFDPNERREGFGLFIGGKGLEGAAQSYTYFLIRQDGRYIIKKRNGAQTPTVTPWTEHEAIVKWAAHGTEPTVRNVLAIDVGPRDVAFLVNGKEVERMPRAQLDSDGIVGLRVSHALDVHITKIAIDRK